MSILVGCGDKKLSMNTERMTNSNVSSDYFELENENEVSVEENTTNKEIYVQICGAVQNPGVYKINESIRVFEALDLAGGVLEGANTDSINLTEPVMDQMKIYVPDMNDETLSLGNDLLESNELLSNEGYNDLININTASVDELMTLPGIGEVKAKSIVAYRKEQGKFTSIEQIKNISGIKESAYNKIKDRIKV